MSEEQSVPKALVLAARWAIQEVDDLFALNLDEPVEDELSARVAHALYPAIAISQARLSEAVKVLEAVCAIDAGRSELHAARQFLATLGEET